MEHRTPAKAGKAGNPQTVRPEHLNEQSIVRTVHVECDVSTAHLLRAAFQRRALAYDGPVVYLGLFAPPPSERSF